MNRSKTLLLDEPMEGLAPVIMERLASIIKDLKAHGLSILPVEQSLDVCMAVADQLQTIGGGTHRLGRRRPISRCGERGAQPPPDARARLARAPPPQPNSHATANDQPSP